MSTGQTTTLVGDFVFTFDSQGKKDKPTFGRLSIRHKDGKKDLLSDMLDIGKDSLRRKFVGNLLKDNPKIDVNGTKQELLRGLLDIEGDVRKSAMKSTPPPDVQVESSLDTIPPEVFESAWKMLESDDLFEQIARDIEDMGITGEDVLSKTLYLIMSSRYLSEPLAGVIQGASSSGKSFNIERVAELIPPQGKLMAHDFSPQALSYKPPGSLKHKVVICGERLHSSKGNEGHAEDNSKAFREMRASGKYIKEVVGKNDKGVVETRRIEQEGPIAYIESTTATYIPDEDSTRLIKLTSNESEEQTGRIQELQKRKAKGETADAVKRAGIISKHHALQCFLAPFLKEPPQIIIPFIDHISLPNNVVSTRRTFPYVVSMIEAVALLRQYQHSKTGGVAPDWEQRRLEVTQVIVADKEDYRVAYFLILPILEKMYGSLPSKSKNMLSTIIEKTGTSAEGIVLSDGRKTVPKEPMIWNEFTVRDSQEWSGVSNSEAWRRLKPLTYAGIISYDDKKKPYKFKVVNPELANTIDILSGGLPTPDAMDKLIANDELRRF